MKTREDNRRDIEKGGLGVEDEWRKREGTGASRLMEKRNRFRSPELEEEGKKSIQLKTNKQTKNSNNKTHNQVE